MKTKFRAWDDRNNKWITEGDIYMTHDGRFFAGDFDNPPVVAINESNITFSTGVQDVNGKEIYVGDVVKTLDGDTGEIVFRRGKCIRRINDLWGETLEYEVEVIGNIYDNPELIN
jgi:hypothetical protein